MAKAKAQTETRTRTESYQETTGYTLALTPDEAAVLVKVLGNVGGYPNGSRGKASRVRGALIDAGVKPAKAELSGTVQFTDGSDPIFGSLLKTNEANW